MTYIRNNKALVFIIAILFLSNIALLYFFVTKKGDCCGQENGTPSKSPRQYMIETLTNEVGFNADQIKKYEALSDKHKQIIKPLFQELKFTKDSLYKMLSEPLIADSSVKHYLYSIGDKQRSIDENTFYHFLAMRELCTAEQRPKFDTVIQRIVKNMINAPKKNSGSSKDKK